MISTALAVSEPFISSATTVAEIVGTAAAVSKAVMISTAAIVSIRAMIETVGAVSTHISPGLPIRIDLQRPRFRNFPKKSERELQIRGKLGGVQGLNTPLAPPSRGIPQVIIDGPFWRRKKLHFPCIIDSSPMKLRVKYSDRRAPIAHATRSQSTSLICCAAAAMSEAVETRPETTKYPDKAPLAIGLLYPPKLDDGGTRLPPSL